MEFRPKPERRARYVLNRIFESMDKEERKKNKKTIIVKGKRAEFLEKYKSKGFDEAKRDINAGFGKEVYNNAILKKWIKEEIEK